MQLIFNYYATSIRVFFKLSYLISNFCTFTYDRIFFTILLENLLEKRLTYETC